MRCPGLALTAAALFAVYTTAIAADAGRIDLVVEGAAVELGQAFPLTVVRQWDASLVAEEFDETALAPLVVRLSDTSQREADGMVEQTLRFDAYAFALDEVTVPAPSFVARASGGGLEQVVRGEALTVRVGPALRADSPVAPELPGDPLPLPFPWAWVLPAAAGLLVAGGVVARRLRARPSLPPPAPPEPVPAPDAGEILLVGLDALAAGSPAGRAELRAWYDTGAALLRDYVRAQHLVGAPEHTSEEVVDELRHAAAVAESERVALTSLLSRCDAVKFAAAEPSAAACDTFITDARSVAGAAS